MDVVTHSNARQEGVIVNISSSARNGYVFQSNYRCASFPQQLQVLHAAAGAAGCALSAHAIGRHVEHHRRQHAALGRSGCAHVGMHV